MVQTSKMNKIKNIIKRWQSFRRLGRSYSNLSSNPTMEDDWDISCDFASKSSSLGRGTSTQEAREGCKTVYVGKSRRRYFISAHHLNHPLLRLLSKRCRDDDDDHKEAFAIDCEVVLFEHLVWMLENADPEIIQSDSLEELVQFYACS